MKNYFIVEDNVFYSNLLKEQIEALDATVSIFNNGEDCINHLHENPHTIILDYYLEGELTGIDILKKIKAFNPNINVVFLTAQNNMEVALNSLRYGAFDYIEKNEESIEKMQETIERINQLAALQKQDNQTSFLSFIKKPFTKLAS